MKNKKKKRVTKRNFLKRGRLKEKLPVVGPGISIKGDASALDCYLTCLYMLIDDLMDLKIKSVDKVLAYYQVSRGPWGLGLRLPRMFPKKK